MAWEWLLLGMRLVFVGGQSAAGVEGQFSRLVRQLARRFVCDDEVVNCVPCFQALRLDSLGEFLDRTKGDP